jgi:hypothetical protein
LQAAVNQQREIEAFATSNYLKEVQVRRVSEHDPERSCSNRKLDHDPIRLAWIMVWFGGPMFALDYCDQAGTQPPTAAGVFRWSEGVPITARQLIAERVRQEFEPLLERFDARGGELPLALVTKSANARAMTLDEAIETALRAFSANRFFLLVDRRQITGLDAPFPLTPKSTVVFLRLAPLKGG